MNRQVSVGIVQQRKVRQENASKVHQSEHKRIRTQNHKVHTRMVWLSNVTMEIQILMN